MPTSTPLAATGPTEDERVDSAVGDGDPPAREVVVGVDGTESALSAVRWAAQEAERRQAPLRILHAAPYLSRRGPAGTGVERVASRRRLRPLTGL